MPKCGYCKSITGSVWGTPELVDICFGCMRRQRDELHAQVAAEGGAQGELRASYERLTSEFAERSGVDTERLGTLTAERDQARSFAQGVYMWGPKAQIPVWEAALPWLKGGEPAEMSPFEDCPRGRLVLLEATVKTLYADLTRLMAALEELG